MEDKKTFFDRVWNFFAYPFHRFSKRHPEFYSKHRDIIGSAVCGFVGAVITYIICSFMPYIFGRRQHKPVMK